MKDKIVYTFCREDQLLTQLRRKGKYAGEHIFPGGNVEPTDATISAALFRELLEETDTEPTGYYRGPIVEIADKDLRLHPFLIVNWLGSIPEVILDDQDPLEWKDWNTMREHSNPDVATLANIFYTLVHPQIHSKHA